MATPEDINAERVNVCGGTTRGPPKAKEIKKAVEVLFGVWGVVGLGS